MQHGARTADLIPGRDELSRPSDPLLRADRRAADGRAGGAGLADRVGFRERQDRCPPRRRAATATNLFDQDRADSGSVANGIARETGRRRPVDDRDPRRQRGGRAQPRAGLREPPRDRVRRDHRLVGARDGRGRLAARSHAPRSTWSSRTAGGRHDRRLRPPRATPTSRGRDDHRRGGGADRPAGPGRRRARRRARATCPSGGEATDVERGDEQLRAAATEPLGAEQVARGALRPGRRRGLLRLAAEDRDRAASCSSRSRWSPSRSSSARCRATCARCSARRGGSARATSHTEVPVSGGDEMAGLASEFNKMSGRLADQMDELRRQRVEIEMSTRRIGDAFASGLDRQALLAILVETAVGACERRLRAGRAQRPRRAEAEAGKPDRSGPGGGAGRREPGAARAAGRSR